MREETPRDGNGQEPDRVRSEHDHDEPSPPSRTPQQKAGVDRGPVDLRPDRSTDLPKHARRDAPDQTPEHGSISGGSDRFDDTDEELFDAASHLDPQVLALIQASAHLHLPIQLPDASALVELRNADPAAYKFWMDNVGTRLKHDMWMERAPVELPARLARRSQVASVLGLLIVAALAAYAMHLDHAWVSALLGTLDFVGIIAAFQDGRDNDDKSAGPDG